MQTHTHTFNYIYLKIYIHTHTHREESITTSIKWFILTSHLKMPEISLFLPHDK